MEAKCVGGGLPGAFVDWEVVGKAEIQEVLVEKWGLFVDGQLEVALAWSLA